MASSVYCRSLGTLRSSVISVTVDRGLIKKINLRGSSTRPGRRASSSSANLDYAAGRLPRWLRQFAITASVHRHRHGGSMARLHTAASTWWRHPSSSSANLDYAWGRLRRWPRHHCFLSSTWTVRHGGSTASLHTQPRPHKSTLQHFNGVFGPILMRHHSSTGLKVFLRKQPRCLEGILMSQRRNKVQVLKQTWEWGDH